MQKILTILVVTLLSIGVFTQCKSGGGGGKKPETVAMAFLKSFADFDFTKAKKYCTEEAIKVIEFMESMVGMVSETEKEEFKKKTGEDLKNLKSMNCRIEGEKAFCKICCDESGKESPDEPVRLKKVDGKWLVDMSKEDLNMGGQ